MTSTSLPETFPLLGRSEELARLHAAIERALAGRGGAMVVRGQAGIGKTRLLEAACAAAQSARARSLGNGR